MHRSVSESSAGSVESTTPLKRIGKDADLEAIAVDPVINAGPSLLFKCVLVIVCVSEVVLGVLVVYLFLRNVDTDAQVDVLKRTLKRQEALASSRDAEGFCLSCSILDNVFIEGDIKVSDYFEVEAQRQKCCVQDLDSFMKITRDVTKRLLSREVIKVNPCNAEETNRQTNATCARNRKPAVHLVRGGERTLRHTGPEGQQLPHWIEDSANAFVSGFSVQNGRLVVLETGNYYVYSQVYFVETFTHVASLAPTDPPVERPKRVWHAVYKSNPDFPGYEVEVLKTTQSKCWAKNKDFGMHTSYLGAVLSLRAGDHLSVKVSNISLVPSDPSSTFFGAYMV